MNMLFFFQRLKNLGLFIQSDVLLRYASARRFLARLESETFLNGLREQLVKIAS